MAATLPRQNDSFYRLIIGQTGVVLVVVAGLCLTGTLFWSMRQSEREHLQALFELDATRQATQIAGTLEEHVQRLEALRRFHEETAAISPAEFTAWVHAMQDRRLGALAVAWLPRVAVDENTTRYPLGYLAPLTPDGPAVDALPVDFDAAAEPACLEFLEQAQDHGAALATQPAVCFGVPMAPADLLLATPVCLRQTADVSRPSPSCEPRGFLLGLYQTDAALTAAPPADLAVELSNTAALSDEAAFDLHYRHDFFLAQQPWRLAIDATPVWREARQRMGYWLILPTGLALTALFALYLHGVRARRTGAEARARASEQKFRRLLEEIPSVAVQGYNRERRAIFWNSASEQLYGYRRAQALGQLLEDLIIPPALRSSVIQNIDQRLAGGSPIPSGELELLRQDGSTVPVYSSHALLINHQGEPELYCLDIDLSERKRAEAALAQREVLLEVAALTASRLLKEPEPSLAIAMCFAQLGCAAEVDRVYLFENHCCPRTGALLMSQRHEWCADRATVQMDNPLLQNLPYDQGGFARWRQVLAANEPIAGRVREFPELERAILEPQGIITLLVMPILVHGEFWGFIGLDDCQRDREWTAPERHILQSIAGNIGEAIARQRAEMALQDSEERFRRLADNMRDLVCQIDVSGTVLYTSPSYQSVLGYEPQALLGHSVFDGLHPDDRATVIATYQQALARHEAGLMEFRQQCADGSYLWLESLGNPLYDAAGQLLGAVISSRDISERKHAEEERRLALQVFENSREAIMITDAQARILSVNRAFSDTTGYRADQVMGQTPHLLASGRHGRDFYQKLWHALVTEGHWQGEIWNRRKNGEIYPEWLGISAVYDTLGELTHYVGIFSDLSERKASADRIEFLAHHDPLTALPNRHLLHDRLERALFRAERTQAGVALLCLDLDRFTLINDSLGHDLGDQLLQMVAIRLHKALRETDTVSRQGGDEFLILLPDTGQDGAACVVRNLLRGLESQPFYVAEHRLVVTASIGVSLYPEHGSSREALLRQAGVALHYAKSGGGNTYRFFSIDMESNTLERLQLETDLRLALERNEFMLYYQPQVELASGRIVGAEALLRWRHAERGLIAPGQFIPIAESSGLILPIGDWVLREACRQNRAWEQAGLPRISVAVNLSALQFQRVDLLDEVSQALAAAGLRSDSLELELTESILIQNIENTLRIVERLRLLGLRLAIDDFGTGYSSLSYLQKLAVHTLKIDQSFVQGLVSDASGSAAIIRAIIQLAHSLKLITVAEGVETAAQLAFLREQGCDQVQGYYFSRPLPADDFAGLLAQTTLSAAG